MHIFLTFLLLFPLAGAICMVFSIPMSGPSLPRRVGEAIACLASIGAFFMAAAAMATSGGDTIRLEFWQWLAVPGIDSRLTILYDPLAAVMALMVTLVAALIHIYSVPFMRKETDYLRYFFLLNLFVFCMLVIVLADDLLFLFLGWEGVGFCSYGLIGFWYRDPANCLAGRKAFLLTRIGDAALAIAIAIFFAALGSLSLTAINQQAGWMASSLTTLAGLLLLGAAMAKSAQLPLQVWLPDAMAGPTPVSALIHAATMVTAGVYLLLRFFPVLSLSPEAMLAIAFVGTVTALFGAAAALSQRDIKRLLAWSTISQVGFMFLGVGAGDVAGSMFHLLSHGFFKSLLFLGAGCIIHLLDDEHDIFRMGRGLRRHHPALFLAFTAGVVSLAGIPPAAGFFSKGEILASVFLHPDPGYRILWAVALLAALLTALYAFRLLLLSFFGETASGTKVHPGSVSPMMIAILWPLALLSLFGGLMELPAATSWGRWLTGWLGNSTLGPINRDPATTWSLFGLDGLLALLGLGLAWFCYGPTDRLGLRRPDSLGPVAHEIFLNGFGADRFYQTVFVLPYRAAAEFLWQRVDENLVDNGLLALGRIPVMCGQVIRQWTTGRLTTSLRSLLLGTAAILCLLVLGIWGYLP